MKFKENRNIMVLLVVALIALFIIGSAFIYRAPINRYEGRRDMMGTYVRIVVYDTSESQAMDAIEAAFEKIAEVSGIASRYNPDSELYRLNEEGKIEGASDTLIELIELSIDFNDITGGAFDVTITPLLDLWSRELVLTVVDDVHEEVLKEGNISQELRDELEGIEPPIHELEEDVTVYTTEDGWSLVSSWQTYQIRPVEEGLAISTNFWLLPYDTQEHHINQTMDYVGTHRITVDNDNIYLEEGMYLTLDGIAKGYAVDRTVEVLKSKGIESGMVDAGGDIATFGLTGDGDKWVIGLRNPDDLDESIMEFALSGEAIATSGNYERYFDEDARVGHIMDPATGRTVSLCSSATVIAPDCVTADALATAIFVLGPENGTALVNGLEDIESLILHFDDPSEMELSNELSNYMMNED